MSSTRVAEVAPRPAVLSPVAAATIELAAGSVLARRSSAVVENFDLGLLDRRVTLRFLVLVASHTGRRRG
jgi:hypothetical protein